MELWVRSQDKETLMKVNRIDIENNSIICYDNDYHCNETYMGTYKTKERALEVLDEIDNVKGWKYLAELNYSAFKRSLESDYSDKEQQEIFEMMNTYEMPEE